MKHFVCATAIAVATLCVAPAASSAFCGFYVSGADAKLFNNATQVALMREGTRTVLSMQNNYQGPPKDFAMVVPVPVVLQKENVKTLPREIFDRIDQLSAPRLVEYWERDPCEQEYPVAEMATGGAMPRSMARAKSGAPAKDLGVTIEAEFTAGEYQIVILSAKDSTGLDTWLRQENYKIPAGAEPYLKPYVEGGSKFFVAKVDVEKVKFENGQALLSPLRFFYDSKEFSLPIRLGMMNSSGTQDLIVTILSPNQRYEVANYENVTIPTNLDVKSEARERFGEFYAALFDRTLEKNPGAVVTEYSWDAGTCDPCPVPGLTPSELATLGLDVLDAPAPSAPAKPVKTGKAGKPKDAVDELLAEKSVAPQRRVAPRGGRPMPPRRFRSFVLTRLHARYNKGGIEEDLMFRAAKSIAGGREWRGSDGKLEEGTVDSHVNNFQARYAIRHEWTGPIECENPIRGRWGGPPAGVARKDTGPKAATDLAFVPRGKTQLAMMVRQDIPEIDVVAGEPAAGATTGADGDETEPTAGSESSAEEEKPFSRSPRKDKKGCAIVGGSPAGWALMAVMLVLARQGRRRRQTRGDI